MDPTTTYGGVGGDTPPFWPPSTTRSHRRNPPSPFLNPAFVFVILPLIFFLLTLFLVPTFFSRNSQIAKPSTTNNTKGSSVKKTWDLFNVLLVLFAVLCGIFAKKTANDDYMTSSTTNSTGPSDDVRNMNLVKSGEQFGGVSSSNQWLDSGGDDHHHHRLFSDTRVPESNRDVDFNQLNDGSAFSDLRHEQVIPMNGPAGKYGSDERFKFFDDFDINRTLEMNDNVVPVHHRRRSMGELSEFKPVPVDKFVVADSTQVNPPPLESAGDGVTVGETVSPPSPPVRKPRKTTHHPSVSRMVDVQKRARSPPPPAKSMQAPPPTSLPPPEVVTLPPPEVEDGVLEKKKKSANAYATKEIKTVLASIYNPVKRKKKNKTKVIIDESLSSEPDIPVDSSPPSMQPPPPPPPPPSVFKLFKKSIKNKKIHSVPPPAPPPPPRRHHRQNTPLPPPISQPQPEPQSQPKPPQRAGPSQRRTHSTTTTGRPPLPNKINSFSYNADNRSLSNNSGSLSNNSGSQSPLLPMPPPPVPPFQISAMKFTAKGDYIRIRSGPSTICSSPELDSSSKESPWSSNVTDGGDVIAQTSSVFCPSPDVNMKADTFIARLRDEWKNDKINSMKGKQKLGRVPGSNSIN